MDQEVNPNLKKCTFDVLLLCLDSSDVEKGLSLADFHTLLFQAHLSSHLSPHLHLQRI